VELFTKVFYNLDTTNDLTCYGLVVFMSILVLSFLQRNSHHHFEVEMHR